MKVDLDKVDSKLFSHLLGEQFAFNMQMYEYRLKRVLSIDTTIKENQMEYLMTFDAFLALFRGLFLENFKGCYTVQNYFTALGREDIAAKIDAFLDGPFNEYSNETIRRALKFLADKFVCHLFCRDRYDKRIVCHTLACIDNKIGVSVRYYRIDLVFQEDSRRYRNYLTGRSGLFIVNGYVQT